MKPDAKSTSCLGIGIYRAFVKNNGSPGHVNVNPKLVTAKYVVFSILYSDYMHSSADRPQRRFVLVVVLFLLFPHLCGFGFVAFGLKAVSLNLIT